MDITANNTGRISLSNDILFGSYLRTIVENGDRMCLKGSNDKFLFYEKLVNYLSNKMGFPQRIIMSLEEVDQEFKNTIAATNFDKGDRIGLTRIRLEPKPRASFKTEKEFRNFNYIQYLRISVTIYHELRHSEQLFRGLQYFAQKDTTTIVYDRYGKPFKTKDLAITTPSEEKDKVIEINKKKYLAGGLELGTNIWVNAKTKALPKELEEFAKIMSEAIIKNRYENSLFTAEDRTYKEVIERDAYNFSREGYRIMNLVRGISRQVSDMWNPNAFNNITKGIPSGYIDKYAGDFSTRIDLTGKNKEKYPLIPII